MKSGSIYYEAIGEGLPLIILHSMGTDHRSMKAWLEPIFHNKCDYQRIYVDLPAHGHSEIDSTVKSTDDILSNVLEFIDVVLKDEEFALNWFILWGIHSTRHRSQKKKQCKKACIIGSGYSSKRANRTGKSIARKESINTSRTRCGYESCL